MPLVLVALGVAALLGGCKTYTVELSVPETLLPSHELRVGAAREEITPVPGLPMGGYGFIGQTARGFWTRLYANALVIEDPDGTPLVLVSCDLWALPGGLADEVAARVRADSRGLGIGREHIVIAATHTHQSPGAYASELGYNAVAGPESGFDPALFDFLATRISRAILRAANTRAPATMSWRDGYLARLVRNRSMDAFHRNPESETSDFVGPGSAAPYCDLRTPVADRDACRAVDATATVVRFERDDTIIGAAIFAAFHPTAAGPGVAVYSSDVFGIAGIHAARQLQALDGGDPPVLAFFNGAEGDVSPDWRQQDGPHALALGRQLGAAVTQLAEGGTREEAVAIDYAFERFELAGACHRDAEGTERCAASRPVVGRATLAGASDGRTHSWPSIFRPGVTRTSLGPQGVKVPAMDPGFGWFRLPLSALIMLPVRNPTNAALGVYRLGPLAIATLPGEFTTMMGRRIAVDVARALPSTKRVLLAGLANAYMSYFTTPEEYEGQFYEGASTLYGPESGPVIGAGLARLATMVEGGKRTRQPRNESIAYSPGPERLFGLEDVGTPHVSDEGLGHLLHEPPYDQGQSYPSTCWTGAAPRFPDVQLPTVAIEIADDDTWSPLAGADNFGTDIITVASPRDDGTADWRAIWMPNPTVPRNARVRFVVRPVESSADDGADDGTDTDGPDDTDTEAPDGAARAPIHGAPFTLDGADFASSCPPS